MRYAIVSDIHANRPAWTAVLDDIAREGVDHICCLGDIVGYGPRPRAVLDSVLEHCENIVLGNHDAVIAGKLSPSAFNVAARSAIVWTRDRLGEEWELPFASLPMTLRGDGMLLTHGDAVDPGKFRYVTKPEHARASFKATKGDVIFFGHTHQPGVFVQGKGGKAINKLPAREMVLTPERRFMVNPGSVGDPRCRSDLRASYCIYDSETHQLWFRRVEFDVDEYRRDFAASGLSYKPFFLRVLDAESAREGDALAEVADHREAVEVDAGSDKGRLARLNFGQPRATAPAWSHAQRVAVQEAARRQERHGKFATWMSMLVVAGLGVGLGFLLPLGADKTAQTDAGDAPDLAPRPTSSVTLVSTATPVAPAADKVETDLERILSDGWEDPEDSGN